MFRRNQQRGLAHPLTACSHSHPAHLPSPSMPASTVDPSSTHSSASPVPLPQCRLLPPLPPTLACCHPFSVRVFPVVPKFVVLWHEVAHLVVLPSLEDLFQQILLAEAVSIQNAAPKQKLPPGEHLLTGRKQRRGPQHISTDSQDSATAQSLCQDTDLSLVPRKRCCSSQVTHRGVAKPVLCLGPPGQTPIIPASPLARWTSSNVTSYTRPHRTLRPEGVFLLRGSWPQTHSDQLVPWDRSPLRARILPCSSPCPHPLHVSLQQRFPCKDIH